MRLSYNENDIFIRAPDFEPDNAPRRSYNFPVLGEVTNQNIDEHLRYIFGRQNRAFKLNLAVGVMLRHTDTGELRYYRTGTNSELLEDALQIENRQSLEIAIQLLQDFNINEIVRNYRPNSKFQVVWITNVEYYVYELNYPVGDDDAELPDFVRKNRYIINNTFNSKGQRNPPNLCLFISLAQSLCANNERRDVKRSALKLQTQWLAYKARELFRLSRADQVHLYEFPHIEKCFGISLTVYQLISRKTCITKYTSTNPKFRAVYLHIYNNHVNLITKPKAVASRYACQLCNRLFKSPYGVKRHSSICQNRSNFTFKGSYFRPVKDIFTRLEENNIVVPVDDRNFPWFIVF